MTTPRFVVERVRKGRLRIKSKRLAEGSGTECRKVFEAAEPSRRGEEIRFIDTTISEPRSVKFYRKPPAVVTASPSWIKRLYSWIRRA